MNRNRLSILAVLTMLLTPTTGALALVIHVPAEEPTIQAGIDAAVDGDTVLIADGVYTGTGNRDLEFTGKAILVTSQNGPEATVIDCQGTPSDWHRAFHFNKGERESSVVQGLGIRGGYFTYDFGGGILCEGSSPTITECILQNNVAYHGGGIYCADTSMALIVGNLFLNNTALGT